MALPNTFTNLYLNETQEDSLVAGATILQYQAVYLSSTGTILPANNIADNAIGVAKQPIANANVGVVRLYLPMAYGLANANINVGDPVTIATSGLVSPTLANTTSVVGVARTPTNGGSNMALSFYGVRRGVLSA
jgi:hypothetical protein